MKINHFTLVWVGSLFLLIGACQLDTPPTSEKASYSEEDRIPKGAQAPVAFFHQKYSNPKTGQLPNQSPWVSHYWKRHFQEQHLAKAYRSDRQAQQRNNDEIDWVEVGPTNVGGRTRAIAIDANDNNRLLAGGVRGGLWLTTNKGDSWEHIEGITGNESITHISQHPNQNEKWYATTGEYIGNGGNFYGGGLLFSNDNGLSWDIQQYQYQLDEATNEFRYLPVDDFPISSFNPNLEEEGNAFQFSNKIQVSPKSNTTFVATNGWGVLRSADGIASFGHSLPSLLPKVEPQLLPVDDATSLLLRFEDKLEGEQGEIPINTPVVEYPEGVFGKGVYLDSTDIIDFSSMDNMDDQAGTVEFWIKQVWDGNQGSDNVFLELGDFPFIIFIHRVNDYMETLIATGDGNDWLSTGSNITDWNAEEWHHLAFSWDNTQIAFYLDGVKLGQEEVQGLPEIDKSFLRIGNPFDAGIRGVIDEFRISNRARSAIEINQSYQFGLKEQEVTAEYPVFRPTFSDFSINAKGEIISTLSGNRADGAGVYLSKDDGKNWSDITPISWPDFTGRGAIAHAPSNPDIAYALIDDVIDDQQDARLFYFDLANGTSEDRSDSYPQWKGMPFPNDDGRTILASDYNLFISVKPDDENFVVLGGIFMARSFDGFSTPADSAYKHNIVSNSHVDFHTGVFDPENPDHFWSGNDGGLYFTQDIKRIDTEPYTFNIFNVIWEDKNKGYNVTQFYTVAQSEDSLDHRVVGGAQDNGYLLVNPADPKLPHRAFGEEFGSDGSFVFMTPDFNYMSFQFGETYKLKNGSDGNASFEVEWTQISPPVFNRGFIHPWAVDPVDVNTMYYPIENRMYRIDDIDQVPAFGSYGEENYDLLTDGASLGHENITALAVSTTPAHTLYYGALAENPTIKRIKNADTDNPIVEDVSIPNSMAWSYINCIAPNPTAADEWLVVFSNYNIPGLFHTTDGGQTYQLVEGNLASQGAIPGPSMEWADILVFENQTYYFLATNIGVFMTQELDGANTLWEHQGTETVGYALAKMVRTRASDGKVVVATHGRGFFAGYLTPPAIISSTTDQNQQALALRLSPNPAIAYTQLLFKLDKSSALELELFDLSGKRVFYQRLGRLNAGSHQYTIPLGALSSGIYLLRIGGEGYMESRKLVKT